jgi:hypothetical protein
MSFPWSFNPRTAPVGFASCCVVLVLLSLGFLEIRSISSTVQFGLFVLFCLALGFAGFSVAREQSKSFGVMALFVGAIAFISPIVLFLWFPGVLRH